VYRCDHTAPEKPDECRHARFLLFKFYYSASKRLSPYGEIAYNYAEMCLDATSVREGEYSLRRFFLRQSPTQPCISGATGGRLHLLRTKNVCLAVTLREFAFC